MSILLVILLGLFIGYSVQKLAEWLDYTMDYGNIFHRVRLEIIREFADYKMAEFDKKYQILSQYDANRVNEIDQLMQEYATNRSRFILCKICFGTHILIVADIATFYFTFDNWALFPFFCLASISTFMK
jgi:hypothetical protein